jgi:hypothetical protein
MKPKVLIQLDTDPQPSVFDAVVAVDAGVDHLLRHGNVTPAVVTDLIHGALFTRGISDLHATAIFVGGTDVKAGEEVLAAVTETFFGPFRVSVMLDSNGANTTAAAAVLAAERSYGEPLKSVPITVLGATGSVGQRVARLLVGQGARVAVGSRNLGRATSVARMLRKQFPDGIVNPFAATGSDALSEALHGAAIVIAAGAAGNTLLPGYILERLTSVKVVIDLNAVPPLGIEGIETSDKDMPRGNVKAWGALGVGGVKMKIHKKAVGELFDSNDKVFDAETVLELAHTIE